MSVVTFTPISTTTFDGNSSAGASLSNLSSIYTKYAVSEQPITVAERDVSGLTGDTTSVTSSTAQSSCYMVDTSTQDYQETCRTTVETTETDAGVLESSYIVRTVETVEDDEGDDTYVLQSTAQFNPSGLYVRSSLGDKSSTYSTFSFEYDGISMSNTDASLYFGGSENFRIRHAEDTPSTGTNSLLFEAYDSTEAEWVVKFSIEREA
jgi:hypothetical protein